MCKFVNEKFRMKNFERHKRKCKICKSSKQEEIEKLFREGASLRYIRYKFPIASIMSLSTHFRILNIKTDKTVKEKKCMPANIPSLDFRKPYVRLANEEFVFFIQEGKVYSESGKFICFESEFDKEHLTFF